MKTKQKTLLLSNLFLISAVTTFFVASNSVDSVFYSKATLSANSLILDSSSDFGFDNDWEKISISAQKTTNNNDVRFIASGIKQSTGFGLLREANSAASDYYFASVDKIYGLESITVNFTSDVQNPCLTVEYSYDCYQDVSSDDLTSGVPYHFNLVHNEQPNCFKLYAYRGNIDIQSITLTYTCANPIGYFPGFLTATDDGTEATLTSFAGFYAGTRPVIIPDEYNGLPITSMQPRLFENDYSLGYLSFPRNSGFTTIPEYTCSGCQRLNCVVIPKNITTIGNCAFSNCTGLNKIIFEGNQKEWSNITKGAGWNNNVTASIVYLENIFDPKIDEINRTATYGLYPQSVVQDADLLLALNSLDSSAKQRNGWYEYNGDYYKNVTSSPYLTSYKFDNQESILNKTSYWFKCEPIEWKILSSNNGEYFLVSNMILDNSSYYGATESRTINNQTVYSNNYKYSNVRAFLNGYNGISYNVSDYSGWTNSFFDVAFAFDSTHVKTTLVDNSAYTAYSNNYGFECDDTNDKVFLLSYKDTTNSSYGFSNNEAKRCKTTEYARATGARCSTTTSTKNNGFYWTRSPYQSYAIMIKDDGSTQFQYSVTASHMGIRPCITLKMN